jgi:molybdenum cofactor cytidylyltransferase
MAEIAAIILAAGASSRFRAASGGDSSKLVAPLVGKAVVRHVADAALASSARPIVVVTGHDRDAVESALAGLAVQFVHNAHYADGLASSLKTGVAALPGDVLGALVLLGDMPALTPALIDRLVAAFRPRPEALAAVPMADGRRGNPVLLARALFPAIGGLNGDEGARKLLDGAGAGRLIEVDAVGVESILDVDTPQSLDEARRRLEGRFDSGAR